MKLKYYLRGLGMGIIFATLVMTVSSVIHNNNLSEETIIKEAKKLGMIMPETEDKTPGGLWNTEENTMEETSEETQDTQVDTQEPVVIQDGNITLIEISVYPGDNARQVAERLYENGLVEDSESFRLYLGETGYARQLAVGEYYVPVGATYEEICNVLMRK